MRSLLIALLVVSAPALAGSCDDPSLVARQICDWGRTSVDAPDRFEVASWRLDGAAAESIRAMRYDGSESPNRSGYLRIAFEAQLADGRWVEARATLRGRRRGPALVARRTLRPQEPILAEQVHVVDSDLTTLLDAPIRSLEEVGHRVPARMLAIGRVIDARLLRAEPLVRRGQPTRAVYRRGSLQISIAGTALADGAVGETIPFRKSNGGGARLQATVLADGTLSIGGRP